MDAIESDRPGPERVGKPEPRLTSPQSRPNDQAKVLVARAGFGRWKGEAQIGLRRSVADRIGALHRARPARHPFLGGLRQGGGSAECGHQRYYKTEDRAHAFSPDFVVAVWIIAGRCLDPAVPYQRSPTGGA